MFSLAGSESAEDTSSLLLRILSDTGIVGLLVFAVLIVLVSQNCFEYIMKAVDQGTRLATAGGFCAVFALLCQGLYFDIWNDISLFYTFWLVAAMTVGYIRNGRAELERIKIMTPDSETAASVDLPAR